MLLLLPDPALPAAAPAVIRCGDLVLDPFATLLARHGLALRQVGDGEPIPGTYWGEPEAGLVGRAVWVRPDTPVHSLLHEACHAICMDRARRDTLHTDAGGDDLEESAVCYLQLLLAAEVEGVGLDRIARDMDAWGYRFRLGSTRDWFEGDAEDARGWLVERGLVDAANGRPTLRMRE